MQLTIKEWRRARNFTLADCSEKIGICIGTMRKWERDFKSVPIGKAVELCDLFGISIDDVIF